MCWWNSTAPQNTQRPDKRLPDGKATSPKRPAPFPLRVGFLRLWAGWVSSSKIIAQRRVPVTRKASGGPAGLTSKYQKIGQRSPVVILPSCHIPSEILRGVAVFNLIFSHGFCSCCICPRSLSGVAVSPHVSALLAVTSAPTLLHERDQHKTQRNTARTND